MKLLAVDCSSQNLSLCATDGDKTLFNLNRRMLFGASELIIYLKRYLNKQNMEVKDFEAFVVGAGPGSFTGLRISFSVIKAFALSAQRPVISLESFYSCAYAVREQAQKLMVIADARKKLLYQGLFISKNNTITKKGKIRLISLDGLKADSDSFVVTFQAHLRSEIKQRYPQLRVYAEDVYPQARYLMPLAQILAKKAKYTPLEKLQPLYVHPKTCQIKSKQ